MPKQRSGDWCGACAMYGATVHQPGWISVCSACAERGGIPWDGRPCPGCGQQLGAMWDRDPQVRVCHYCGGIWDMRREVVG